MIMYKEYKGAIRAGNSVVLREKDSTYFRRGMSQEEIKCNAQLKIASLNGGKLWC